MVIPLIHAPNIWKHNTQPNFFLCVDDFGVTYISEADADHLIHSLKEAYEIIIDRKGSNLCGLHLNWDYNNKSVDISMPNYV